MLATSLTAAVVGVEAHLVRVEADTASGFPKFTTRMLLTGPVSDDGWNASAWSQRRSRRRMP